MRGHFRTGDLVRGHFCIAQSLAGCEIDPATERDAKLASQQGGMTQGGTPQQRAGRRSGAPRRERRRAGRPRPVLQRGGDELESLGAAGGGVARLRLVGSGDGREHDLIDAVLLGERPQFGGDRFSGSDEPA